MTEGEIKKILETWNRDKQDHTLDETEYECACYVIKKLIVEIERLKKIAEIASDLHKHLNIVYGDSTMKLGLSATAILNKMLGEALKGVESEKNT